MFLPKCARSRRKLSKKAIPNQSNNSVGLESSLADATTKYFETVSEIEQTAAMEKVTEFLRT